MSYCFNKMNNKVLTFDCFKDIEKIRFNHYIMRKENLNRLNGELPKYQFIMTISTVMKDLNLSKSKAQRIISEFENLGIIRSIVKGNLARGYSIYEYVISDYENYEKHDKKGNEKVNDIEQASNGNESEHNCDTGNDKENSKDFENSKKENIKRDLNKNNIYISIIDYLNKKAKKNFKATTQKTKNCINARLNEGFCENDFYKVIDVKCSQWLYSDMQKFLRPETLFSNKFEGYLNEIIPPIEEVEDGTQSWDIEFDF